MIFDNKFYLKVCFEYNENSSLRFVSSKHCGNVPGVYATIDECYEKLDKYRKNEDINVICSCIQKYDALSKSFNIIRLVSGKSCFENRSVNLPSSVFEVKAKNYSIEHHLIENKVIFCEHKDKSNKLLHVFYKLFDSKRLFAIYDAKDNTLCVIDTEHPDVEEAVLKIYEKYNCIIDFVSLNYLKNKVEGSTCRYKCRVN